MSTTEKRVVVVLGMHRSGTSLGMSVIHSLGVACGQSLIPAGRGNMAGFWEHSKIVAVHERLLASLGRVWHGPKGTHPLPDDWLASKPARRARSELIELVEREVEAVGSGVWGFKDPRTPRFLPLWQTVFEAIGVVPVYVLMVRHPIAVCASMAKQNGVDQARGQLIWLQNNLEAVLHAGDALRLVVEFDNLINQPAHEVERLTSALGDLIPISESEKEAARACVSQKMRTHDTPAAIENAFIREVYESLSRLARDEGALTGLQDFANRYSETEKLFLPWRRDRSATLTDWLIRAVVRRKYG